VEATPPRWPRPAAVGSSALPRMSHSSTSSMSIASASSIAFL
jgi:hypothetical protein